MYSRKEKSLEAGLERPDTKGNAVVVVDASPAESQQVLRKVDFFLLPLLAVCYMLQFLDKSSLNYSTLLGIIKDTGLVGSQYSWTAAIFYFGYLGWSGPTAYLIVKFPIGKYLSATVFLWAVVLMCHAACNNFVGLLVARFFLGVTEAAVAPGFSMLTGMFYTRREQPFRHGIWFLGNAVASIIGGVISFAIGNTTTVLARWRLLFLIFGAITAFWSVVMFVLLPDSPASPVWLNTRQRTIAVARTADNRTGTVKNGGFQIKQMVEALKDPQAWLLALYIFSVNVSNGGLSAFGALVISGFGFAGLEALLLQMPTGAAQFIFILIGCYIASKVKSSRVIVMTSLTIISMIGMVMMFALDNSQRNGKLGGFCLALAFAANQPLGLSLVASNVAGFSKKATVNAMMFVAYCIGNIVGPQFFSPSEAPAYPSGIKASLIGFCLGIFWLLLLGLYYVCENRRRNKVEGSQDLHETDSELSRELRGDLTDWEISSFRYMF